MRHRLALFQFPLDLRLRVASGADQVFSCVVECVIEKSLARLCQLELLLECIVVFIVGIARCRLQTTLALLHGLQAVFHLLNTSIDVFGALFSIGGWSSVA